MNRDSLATDITKHFSKIPQVMAIALGGSQAIGTSTSSSDIDIYVFTSDLIPLSTRRMIVQEQGAIKADLNLDYWDLGDQWIHEKSGVEFDLMYWDTTWIKEQIDQMLLYHQAKLGYSTCHWHTIKNASLLFDREGWFSNLQARCKQPYPQKLRDAIVKKNLPILRDIIPSYTNQIQKAILRKDLININHWITAFLDSFFDIIFAINLIPHPGEKRLLELTPALCATVPKDMTIQINNLLNYTGSINQATIIIINDLIDGLEETLEGNQ